VIDYVLSDVSYSVSARDPTLICLRHVIIYTVNLPDAVTLGRAHDGGGDSPLGLQGHVICCSGWCRLFALKAKVTE